MKAHTIIGAIGALAAGWVMNPAAHADVGYTEIAVGSFRNIGGGDIAYTGDFASFVTSGLEDNRTVIDIDIAGIAASQGFGALAGIRLLDGGGNQYGSSSPGADIDLLSFSNLLDGANFTLAYSGPNLIHQEEDEATLLQRIGTLDASSGDQDYNVNHFVSLGDAGSLTAMLSGLQPTTEGSGSGSGSLTSLRVSEHGFNEAFEVVVFATNVPAPGVLTLFALNLLRRRRARPS